ncbi:hypothetical protein HHI36_016951 [Cryptolaemus montrouzieri]|uniref:Uncharacterized protein n=1 Tax=Cryptolaemus montrouzieri TaxID=559131 RepID=A0ABD2NM74_9CUCU
MDILSTYDFVIKSSKGETQLNEIPLTMIHYTTPCSLDNLIPEIEQSVTGSLEITLRQKQEQDELLRKELLLISNMKGTSLLIKHEIKLLRDELLKQRFRPRNPRMQQILNDEMDRMLQEVIIETSNSP